MSRDDPFRIEGPALISFSGGRTSAFMLWNIVQAHGGVLPDDVVVAFANTGKEREETLRFVHECGSRWGVRIHWVEWRPDVPFEVVGFNSASRAGEPFQALINKKKRLPNWSERWCTQSLKVEPLAALAASFGWASGGYAEVIGLRNDEGHRILKAMNNAAFVWDRKAKREVPRDPARRVVFPLARAKLAQPDVMAFWAAQPFDLGLEPWEGNCDLCFLKGRGIRKRIIRTNPGAAAWWAQNEGQKGKGQRGWFDKRDSVAGLVEEVRRNPDFLDDTGDDEFEECGVVCGSSEGAGG